MKHGFSIHRNICNASNKRTHDWSHLLWGINIEETKEIEEEKRIEWRRKEE